jgi:hypothetical protein
VRVVDVAWNDREEAGVDAALTVEVLQAPGAAR